MVYSLAVFTISAALETKIVVTVELQPLRRKHCRRGKENNRE
jgi:hypothetical protein